MADVELRWMKRNLLQLIVSVVVHLFIFTDKNKKVLLNDYFLIQLKNRLIFVVSMSIFYHMRTSIQECTNYIFPYYSITEQCSRPSILEYLFPYIPPTAIEEEKETGM